MSAADSFVGILAVETAATLSVFAAYALFSVAARPCDLAIGSATSTCGVDLCTLPAHIVNRRIMTSRTDHLRGCSSKDGRADYEGLKADVPSSRSRTRGSGLAPWFLGDSRFLYTDDHA